mmetsp:Transcript_31902/g.70905  ORF Transcript_31902/g.70905 Transcript_31902/m.70905 type:complete len:257 (-) Transcript_31902:563-1333(-)
MCFHAPNQHLVVNGPGAAPLHVETVRVNQYELCTQQTSCRAAMLNVCSAKTEGSPCRMSEAHLSAPPSSGNSKHCLSPPSREVCTNSGHYAHRQGVDPLQTWLASISGTCGGTKLGALQPLHPNGLCSQKEHPTEQPLNTLNCHACHQLMPWHAGQHAPDKQHNMGGTESLFLLKPGISLPQHAHRHMEARTHCTCVCVCSLHSGRRTHTSPPHTPAQRFLLDQVGVGSHRYSCVLAFIMHVQHPRAALPMIHLAS